MAGSSDAADVYLQVNLTLCNFIDFINLKRYDRCYYNKPLLCDQFLLLCLFKPSISGSSKSNFQRDSHTTENYKKIMRKVPQSGRFFINFCFLLLYLSYYFYFCTENNGTFSENLVLTFRHLDYVIYKVSLPKTILIEMFVWNCRLRWTVFRARREGIVFIKLKFN